MSSSSVDNKNSLCQHMFEYLQMSSYLDIFLGINDEPPQRYCPPISTFDTYRMERGPLSLVSTTEEVFDKKKK
jgi:hypothetical protein